MVNIMGLGWGIVIAEGVLKGTTLVGWNMQWVHTQGTAADVGHLIGGFVTNEAHVARDPAKLNWILS